ncbi:Secreted and transmembrane protein 1 [Galemys pyrenaicus]|uniref:Secreted and transmembrane protein 1 n=1 Tax=Galemys pyrenaicus TaxID=202257 RepID=A0A8J6A9W5_GALPY|nr:Secreted and transmembrane protein 1 [Galemys pyrenaicus]
MTTWVKGLELVQDIRARWPLGTVTTPSVQVGQESGALPTCGEALELPGQELGAWSRADLTWAHTAGWGLRLLHPRSWVCPGEALTSCPGKRRRGTPLPRDQEPDCFPAAPMAPPATWLLQTLLLLALALSSQQGVGDAPTCTEGVVTVPRGQRALMSCTSSSPFTHVDIHLKAPRKAAQLIFSVDTPGDFSSAGRRLVVRGGEAQLVIQDAQPCQAGEYTWVLVGRQRYSKTIRLEVTGAGESSAHRVSFLPTPRGLQMCLLLPQRAMVSFFKRSQLLGPGCEECVDRAPQAWRSGPSSCTCRGAQELSPRAEPQAQGWGRPLFTFRFTFSSGTGDAANCTEGVVTVPRGQRALMSCTSSSPFTHVDIHLRAPGKPTQLIFRVVAPGNFSSAGWRLVVQGGEAQLVIQDAQPGHAGEYTWVLVGRQRSTKNTQLKVSAIMAPPAPLVLWTLLLLALALSSQQRAWEVPNCTEGVVTVPRGQRALMSCTSSSPFTHVDICLRAPGKAAQLIFSEDTPGDFSRAGWRLVVQGGEAQLVTQDAQPGQAGEYTWLLVGRKGSMRKTQLEVSDAATPQHTNHAWMVGGIILCVLLCVVGVGLFAWRRSRGPSALETLVQAPRRPCRVVLQHGSPWLCFWLWALAAPVSARAAAGGRGARPRWTQLLRLLTHYALPSDWADVADGASSPAQARRRPHLLG